MLELGQRGFALALSAAVLAIACKDVLGIPDYHAGGAGAAGDQGTAGEGGTSGEPGTLAAPCGAPANPAWDFEGATQGFYEMAEDAPGVVSSTDGALRVSAESPSFTVWDKLSDGPLDLRGKVLVACIELMAFDPADAPLLWLFIDTGDATRTGYSEEVRVEIGGQWRRISLDVDRAALDGGSAPYLPRDVRSLGLGIDTQSASAEAPVVVAVSAIWFE